MFILLFFGGFALVVYGFYQLINRSVNPKPKRNYKPNKYIKEHSRKLEDDKKYQDYLKWCDENNQIPMDEKGFDDIREKENAFTEYLRNLNIDRK